MSDPIYLVDQATRTPQRIAPISFSALNVKERQDLEEWVLKHPEILGERLLVVTSEFDRFDKSSKRLDVLALDEAGLLTIIELKLDVAGTLADQQAIRYAAFCSTMTMGQVVQLYADYHSCSEDEATGRILEFLEVEELPELGNRPRIILAAGSMDDQELTSCVIWLRGFGLDISCVELTPYRVPGSDQILLVPRVIIPLPEARDYIIGVERKEIAKVQDAKEKAGASQLWTMVQEEYQKLNPPLPKTSSGRGSYMQIRLAPGAHLHYEWLLRKSKSVIEVAIHFESSDRDENLARAAAMNAKSVELARGVPERFYAGRWGQKWASAGFSVPFSGAPERAVARRCAELMVLLIDRTHADLVAMLQDAETSAAPPA